MQDVKMSQDEEDQIAKALSEQDDNEIKIEQTYEMVLDNEDTLMTGNKL
jgi:hypothetical protein